MTGTHQIKKQVAELEEMIRFISRRLKEIDEGLIQVKQILEDRNAKSD